MAEEEEEEKEGEENGRSTEVLFHTGEKFSPFEASNILTHRGAVVVLTSGGARSGKTTFLARIGEMFRDGSFGGFTFAESRTLCAFERATWKATVMAGGGQPDTDRTERRENDMFFHLRVQGGDSVFTDVLISDLAGETYPTIVGSADAAANLQAMSRCEHLVLFLDCAKLVSLSERQPEWDNAGTFLRRVHSRRVGGRPLHLQVIFSRWDHVTRHSKRDVQETFCASVETDLRQRFASNFKTLEFFRIAARPRGGNPTNKEIQKVFATWCNPVSGYTPRTFPLSDSHSRDFSAFTFGNLKSE